MVPFNRPSITELEKKYVLEALDGKLCGDGPFTKRAVKEFSALQGSDNVLITTSCSHALELAALLTDIKEGDEVILPSYTFSSTANAFLLRGAKLVFCDIDPATMNLDLDRLESLITERTKVLAPMDYAGVSVDMDRVMAIAKKHGLLVSEDAAQAVGSKYKGKPCGLLADFASFSFHESKNIVAGEGGAIIVKDKANLKKAEIIREKGTDRSLFMRGEVDRYTWRSKGSSYLPSDLLGALLCAQLERFDEITAARMSVWNRYYEAFAPLESAGLLRRPFVPDFAEHNAHMFFLIMPCREKRDGLIDALKQRGYMAVFHYIPLHSAPVGLSLGYKPEDLPLTEEYAGRLVRLPLFASLTDDEVSGIIKTVIEYAGH